MATVTGGAIRRAAAARARAFVLVLFILAATLVLVCCSLATSFDDLSGDRPVVDDAGGGDATAADGAPIALDGTDHSDALPNNNIDASGLIFDDEFTGDLSKWTQGGGGDWHIDNGSVVQSTLSPTPEMFVTGMGEQASYRIESKMRCLDGGVGTAMEIQFRTDPVTLATWHCNWEPIPDNDGKGWLRFQERTSDGVTHQTAYDFPVDLSKTAGYSATMPMTMVVTVSNNVVDCAILEVVGAKTAYGLIEIPRGSFGLRTYQHAAAFEYFRVFTFP